MIRNHGFLNLTLTALVFCGASQTLAQTSQTKQTVADVLAQAQQSSRGGGSQLSSKANTAVPFSNLGFSRDENAKQVDLNSVKPPKSSSILRSDSSGSDMAEYERILDQQIDELFKLTQKFKDSNNRGELWLRLAELYVEKATLVDGRLQDAYDSQIKAFQSGQIKKKPVLNPKEARSYNYKSIQLYEWFQRDFPRDSKIAQAFFFLGYNYFEIGEVKKGADYYKRLVNEFPNSPFVGEARFALGEYYFENDQWANAYKEYSFLIKNKQHRLHTFSLYKGAWCLFRLGRYDQALKYLEFIIKSGRAEVGSSVAGRKVNRNRLESEALRDVIVFYGEGGDPKKAAQYFKGLISGDVTPHLERLAYYYADRGNNQAAQSVFKLLISERPQHPKAFEYQYQVVQGFYYSKNTTQFRDELQSWVRGFGPNSAWFQANKGNKDLIENSIKLRETTLRNYILQQHQTAQNSRAEFSQKMASEGYQLYLAEFPQAVAMSEMRFYYGELLYDMGRYDEASIQYKWVVDNASQSKFYDKAAQNLLIAVEKSVPSDNELLKRVGSSLDPVPMDAKVERFIVAGNWYLEKFPKSDKAAEIKFRIARLYYQHNRFDEAVVIFKGIVKDYPRSKYSEYSANLLLDIYNLKKDFVGLEKVGAELLTVPTIANSKAGSDIRGVLEKASFKRGQDLEVKRDYRGSAEAFMGFAAENTKSELAVTALFNAGVNFERAGDNAKAISSHEAVLKQKGVSAEKVKPQSRRLLAKLYQNSIRFEEAARTYRQAYNEAPKDPLAPNYIFNAAVLYEALGNKAEATKAYEEYFRTAKKKSEKGDALFAMATLQRKSGQSSSAAQKYTEFVDLATGDLAREVEAAYWVAEFSKKSPSAYSTWREKTISLQKRAAAKTPGLGASFVAKLKLSDARSTLRDMTSIRFPADPAKQKAAVDKKTQLLNRTLSELGEVVRLDSAEELVGALALIGDANKDMADAILQAPAPSSLSGDQLKAYKDGVAKFAEGFQVKSREAYQRAIERGWELQVYTPEYLRALDYMSQIDGKQYYNRGEIPSDIRLVNWMNP